METKTIKTVIPEGYEIDKEKSTFENIILKPVEKKRWRDDESASIEGCFIDFNSKIVKIVEYANTSNNYNIYATEKQAKSALAMARISQIMANDERFGGVVTDEEWQNTPSIKYSLERIGKYIFKCKTTDSYNILSFHTAEQRDLFLKENEDLIKDYLMID